VAHYLLDTSQHSGPDAQLIVNDLAFPDPHLRLSRQQQVILLGHDVSMRQVFRNRTPAGRDTLLAPRWPSGCDRNPVGVFVH
jgi:hypothetical protein